MKLYGFANFVEHFVPYEYASISLGKKHEHYSIFSDKKKALVGKYTSKNGV